MSDPGNKTRAAVREMIEAIRVHARLAAPATEREVIDERVLAALAGVPREEFVLEGDRSLAWYDGPLPIGHGQTISQPYIVALMTDLLAVQPASVLLEIGTGSAYQAAVLAGLAAHVYSVESLEPLAVQAQERLYRLGIDNVSIRVGDGYQGWPEHAPYDGIMVTAAAPVVPPALLDQLKPGARLIIPVGEAGGSQELLLVEKTAAGVIRRESILPVAFVPLVAVNSDPA